MHQTAVILCVALAACTSGPVAPRSDQIFYEVTPPAAVAGPGDDFTGRIEQALADDPAAVPPSDPALGSTFDPVLPPGATATPLDDDNLNLNLYTLEQQRIDAAIAERELAEARRQLVIVEPDAVPRTVDGVNIALYAANTSNALGEQRFSRGAFGGFGGNCGRFPNPDQAQRVFLSSGGPERDPYNLDPDGDGFACTWDPEPFRRLGR